MPDDRRVHARTADGWEVVRYDRAGKWYVERGSQRVRVSFGVALKHAADDGATVYVGLPGGKLFDHYMRVAGLA